MNSDKIMGKDIPYPPRSCLLVAGFDVEDPKDEERAIEEAKSYARRQGLTPLNVKIVKDGDAILVVTRIEVFLKE